MGLTPGQVNEMSVWQFGVCVEAWNEAHGEQTIEPPSFDEFQRMKAGIDGRRNH